MRWKEPGRNEEGSVAVTTRGDEVLIVSGVPFSDTTKGVVLLCATILAPVIVRTPFAALALEMVGATARAN